MRLLLQRTARLTLMLAMVEGAGIAQKRVTWSDFSSRMTERHTIRMVLPDSTAVEGRPMEMRSDGMDIRITKTSNRQAQPKGLATIARDAVSVVQVRTPRSRGKWIGTLVPLGVGITVVAASIGRGDETYKLLAAGGLTMSGGSVGGFLVGRAVDRRFEQFVIVK